MNTIPASLLHCLICHQPLVTLTDTGVTCPAGHHFNRARQGYLDLMASNPSGRPEGDSLAMIDAREAFIRTGAYMPIATAAGELLRKYPGDTNDLVLCDLGAGTGYYANEIARSLSADGRTVQKLSADASLYAVRRMARQDPSATVIRMDIWQPFPIADASVDICLVIFAPRNFAEIARILKPDGILLVATPGARHLTELRERFGLLNIQPEKQRKLVEDAQRLFVELEAKSLTHIKDFDADQVLKVIGMGPSARHVDLESVQTDLKNQIGLQVTVDVCLNVFGLR